jgi:threonine/homoserine/homoserine lactone efflux protein
MIFPLMLPDITGLRLFFAAAVLLITPGPAILYIAAHRIDQRRWAGLVSTLGITTALSGSNER